MTTFKSYFVASILNKLINLLNRTLGLSQQLLWELVSVIGDDYNIRLINGIMNEVPELLQDKIEREIDGALDDVEKELPPSPPLNDPEWVNVEEGETPLGGEIGFSYDFVIDLEKQQNEQN